MTPCNPVGVGLYFTVLCSGESRGGRNSLAPPLILIDYVLFLYPVVCQNASK